ncbi:MAG: glycogen synthase GlgA [Deltaproteobacteria bacterium]|jgi:starch synthase|nr:glycogen synthase GlgA [Deltaproteobacteria bacterium]
MSSNLKVVLAASEVTPLAQTGGLAEVAGSLPLAFAELGVRCEVIMPGYPSALGRPDVVDAGIDIAVGSGPDAAVGRLYRGKLSAEVPVWLIRCDEYFARDGLYEAGGVDYPDNHRRFAFFSKAAVTALDRLGDSPPDIVLANDWQTGLMMPYLLEKGPGAPKGVFVIHNQGFLGLAPPEARDVIGLPDAYYGVDGLEYFGLLSYLKAGIVYSRTLVTVSPTYAKEIQTPEFGHGLDGLLREHSFKLHGILNGVDYKVWNPEADPNLPFKYNGSDLEGKRRCREAFMRSAGLEDEPGCPLFVMVSRLTAQKGISLVVESAQDMIDGFGSRLAILGTGDPWFQAQLSELAAANPGRMWLKLDFSASLSHLMMAAADYVLVPSTYEPCGLSQLYALRYGALPVVRSIGGLNDTVRDFAGMSPDGRWDTGFKFGAFNRNAFLRAVRRATALYRQDEGRMFSAMCGNNMLEDFSWRTSALSYYSLFLNIVKSA